MADQAQFKFRAGTAIVFGQASATTIYGSYATTHAITTDALASGSGRSSVEADLRDGGNDLPEFLMVYPCVETGTAPTAGGTFDWYLVFSPDGTNYPNGASAAGNIAGADAAWPADGNEDEHRVQLGDCYPVVVTADGTIIQFAQPFIVVPGGPWMVAVCDNNMSQAVRDETTASDNATGLVVVPYYRIAKD